MTKLNPQASSNSPASSCCNKNNLPLTSADKEALFNSTLSSLAPQDKYLLGTGSGKNTAIINTVFCQMQDGGVR